MTTGPGKGGNSSARFLILGTAVALTLGGITQSEVKVFGQGPPGPPGKNPGMTTEAYRYYMEGLRFKNAGDISNALKMFQTASSYGSSIKEIAHEMAKCYAEEGNYERAYAQFERCLALDARYTDARNNFGTFLAKTGKTDQAETQFRRCILNDPKFPYAYYSLGKLLRTKGDLAGAIENFEHTVNLLPNFGEAQEALGMALYERAAQGDLSQAVDKLERAEKLVPKSPRIHYHLGVIYATNSKLDAAEDQFRQSLMNESQFAASHYELGKLRYYRGDLDRALMELKQAAAVNPGYTARQGYPDVDVIKLKTLESKVYEHMGDPIHELEILQELVAMRKSDAIYAHRIKDLQKEIKRLESDHNKKKHQQEYDPAEVDANISKGIDAYEDGDLDTARAAFQRGLALNPESFRCLQNLCFIQEAQGDLTNALATAEKAQALNPTYDGAVYNLAYLLEKAGLADDAARMYEKFRSMSEFYPWDSRHIVELQQNIIREQKKEEVIRRRGY
jgi:tetratricopeptide (TPR) repeat protein